MKEFGEKIKNVKYLRRPGSYGVIFKDGRIGVVKTSKYETYFLVGGGIEKGESEAEALRREALEEIGSQIEVKEKIGGAIEYFYSKKDGQYIAKECRFYSISLGAQSLEKGGHELFWIDGDQLDKMHHQSFRWIIERQLAAA